MSERSVDYLLIGGGMASAYCAAELRKRGAEGSIMLVGREPEPPYERPPLSKQYLRGLSGRADAYVKPPDWYRENQIELLTSTTVMSLDSAARTAKLQRVGEVGFDKALLATGAMVNILRVDGAQLDGVHYLRAFGNSDSIRDELEGASHVVLIGGSYIGTEVAASLRELGIECSIVMLEQLPLSRVFGDDAGRYFADLLSSKGIGLYGGEELEAFVGQTRIEAVQTKSGKQIPCDAVIVGAGVRPDVMLAQRGGLEVENGVVCDARLQSSVEGIFAAGDCCSFASERFGRLRVEHWDVAMQQGRHVAAAMLGESAPYQVVPYFYSDLSDWAAIEYVGHARNPDRTVLRGNPADGSFSVWYFEEGNLAAVLSVGRSGDLIPARGWIAAAKMPQTARDLLGDVGSDLTVLD